MLIKPIEKGKDKHRRFFNIRVPLFYLVISLICSLAFIIWEFSYLIKIRQIHNEKQNVSAVINDRMQIQRSNDYAFTRPLFTTDVISESKVLEPLKLELESLIQQKEQQGLINDASIYVRKLNDGSWISINGNEAYHPGSLIKVPVLICYLKKSETEPGLLKKELFFDKPKQPIPLQTYGGNTITPGRKYKILELLQAMIVNSDNYATHLLNQHLDVTLFKKLFTDIGIPEPDVSNPHYSMTAIDFSRFLRVLYNSSYLNNENSESALRMLSESTFKDAMLKFLPANIKVAHKFGEQKVGSVNELHESGIIYEDDDPYLVTIMTKGNDIQQLPEVIGEFSKLILDKTSGKH